MRFTTLLAALAAYIAISFGFAFASDWTVNRVSRIASYSTDGSNWTRLVRGMRIPGRSWIVTQRGARVQVSRGRDVVLVNPGTQVFLASTQRTHGKARLTLKKGVVTMKVRKGRKKRISVTTPHLTAVVKGTTFTVGVNRRDSYVSVSSGRVGVTSKSTGRSVDVTAGQKTTGRSAGSSQASSLGGSIGNSFAGANSPEPNGVSTDAQPQSNSPTPASAAGGGTGSDPTDGASATGGEGETGATGDGQGGDPGEAASNDADTSTLGPSK
ncbi:MAG: FecR family protein [Pseudomonadota bacterium]